jgi:Homeodomain-like domain
MALRTGRGGPGDPPRRRRVLRPERRRRCRRGGRPNRESRSWPSDPAAMDARAGVRVGAAGPRDGHGTSGLARRGQPHCVLESRGLEDKLSVPRATFYRWYDRYREGGPEGLADHRSRPDRVWNRIPEDVRRHIIALALEVPELSPRQLAVRFTDVQSTLSRRLRSIGC